MGGHGGNDRAGNVRGHSGLTPAGHGHDDHPLARDSFLNVSPVAAVALDDSGQAGDAGQGAAPAGERGHLVATPHRLIEDEPPVTTGRSEHRDLHPPALAKPLARTPPSGDVTGPERLVADDRLVRFGRMLAHFAAFL